MNNDKRILAFISLGLLLTSLLGPFFMAANGRADLAISFAAVAALLTLLFGMFSWSERIGRVVTIVCLATTVIGGLVVYGAHRFRDGFSADATPRSPEVATPVETPPR